MALDVEHIAVLLLVSAVVAMLARRVRLPYTVGLVAAGAALAFLPVAPRVELTRELLFTALLPPLIFEAAYHIEWSEFRHDMWLLATLVTLGVLLSGAASAAGMHFLVGWEWAPALLFGALMAATDPVSVIATFKGTGVGGRIRLLVEAESLLNDGTAAVAFAMLAAATSGQAIGPAGIAAGLLVTVVGSVLAGAAVGGGVLLLAGNTDDYLVEITFTTVAAYGSFLLAEHFHLSGVLACLTAGLLVGNVGRTGTVSARGREAVESFWEYLAFVANSLIFLLLGVREAREDFGAAWMPALVGVAVALAGRALAVYPCCALFARTAVRVPRREEHVLWWGGLRGALSLALALGLPADLPHRGQVVTVTFAIVAFSVIVQGLTVPRLLRRANAQESETR